MLSTVPMVSHELLSILWYCIYMTMSQILNIYPVFECDDSECEIDTGHPVVSIPSIRISQVVTVHQHLNSELVTVT